MIIRVSQPSFFDNSELIPNQNLVMFGSLRMFRRLKHLARKKSCCSDGFNRWQLKQLRVGRVFFSENDLFGYRGIS
jgi:hypothetical protein